MSDVDLDATIRQILGEFGRLSGDVSTFADDDDLYARGLTSHATVTIVMGLEDELDIEFPDELLTKATFSSIGALKGAIRPLVAE